MEESLKSWDTECLLSDMVRIIRTNRPLVVISRFHGSVRDGHGNHQAIGGLTSDAVAAAADPDRFPEQITEEGLRPWTVRKSYRGGVRENQPWCINFDAGQHSPWIGDSYYNFGVYGLSLQRSQTSGRSRSSMGPVPYYYERLSEPGPAPEEGIFDGLDVSLGGLFELTGEMPPAGATDILAGIAMHVHEAMTALKPSSPAAVVGHLTAGLDQTRALLNLLPSDSETAFMLRIKEQQFQHAITTAMGITLTATAQPPGTPAAVSFWQAPSTMGPVVRGQTFEVHARLYNPSAIEADGVMLAIDDPSGLTADDWQIESDTRQSAPYHQVMFTATVPENVPYARPYFFRSSVKENHFQWREPMWIHRPTRPASLRVTATVEVLGVPVMLMRDVKTREADLPYGFVMRKLQVMPAVAVNVVPAQRIVIPQEGGSLFAVDTEVINNVAGGTQGLLQLGLPEGWTADPAGYDLSFAQAGERHTFPFGTYIGYLKSHPQNRLYSCQTQWNRAAILSVAYHDIITSDTMPDKAQDKEYRGVEYRLLPGSRTKARKLAGTAGACRFVWNYFLAKNKEEYKQAKESDGKQPSISFFSLGKQFTQLRKEIDWLSEYSFGIVRYSLKHQADAWQGFFKGVRQHPKFHSRYGKRPSFTIPENVKVKDGRLFIPKVGWMQMRRKGGNPYPDGRPIRATVKKAGRYWKVSLCYEIDAPMRTENGVAIGVDLNTYNAAWTDTTGERGMLDVPKLDKKEIRIRRYQRKLARQQKGSNRRRVTKRKIAKWKRKQKNCRTNQAHQNSRFLANRAEALVREDLKLKNMTTSAKGTAENPGKNVSAKAGLNRAMLNASHGRFNQYCDYKFGTVVGVDPRYTSQTCNACGTWKKPTVKHNADSSVCLADTRIMQTSTRLRTYWPPGLGLLDVEERSH